MRHNGAIAGTRPAAGVAANRRLAHPLSSGKNSQAMASIPGVIHVPQMVWDLERVSLTVARVLSFLMSVLFLPLSPNFLI